MTKRTRYSADFKAHVAFDAIREELILAELSNKHGVHLSPPGYAASTCAGQFTGQAEFGLSIVLPHDFHWEVQFRPGLNINMNSCSFFVDS